jgi:hypothetical protein
VEISEALPELDEAVSAQIELEVLVHTFSDAPDGAFAQRHEEGIEHAQAALAAGHAGLDELSHRRTGLAASLIFILVVLVALALRIRQAALEGSRESTESSPAARS